MGRSKERLHTLTFHRIPPLALLPTPSSWMISRIFGVGSLLSRTAVHARSKTIHMMFRRGFAAESMARDEPPSLCVVSEQVQSPTSSPCELSYRYSAQHPSGHMDCYCLEALRLSHPSLIRDESLFPEAFERFYQNNSRHFAVAPGDTTGSRGTAYKALDNCKKV